MPMRKYQPCDRDREIVLRMAAIPGVTHDDIAFCVTNERTGRAINRRTLEKHYAKELQIGMAVMKEITMKSFVEQIQAHVWPATRLALSNYCGLKDNGEIVMQANTQNNSIEVRIVESPCVNEPVPGPLDIDAKAPELTARLPPPDDIPIVPYRPEPVANPQYRTELDIPGATTPWYRKPLSGGFPRPPRR
jgi:hypothetical protein